jgi:hypothetical protein
MTAKKGMKQGPRRVEDTFKMFDVEEAMYAIQEEHGVLVRWVVNTRRLGEGGGVRVVVEGRKPALGDDGKLVDAYESPWPCTTHQTFLGLVWSLLLRLSDGLAAAEALDKLSSPPPTS